MNLKKKLLKKSHLYVIVDEDIDSAKKVIAHGADIVQLRIKNKSDKFILQKARQLRKFTKKHNVLFLINDRIDIAKLTDADGVHLGQEDTSIEAARKFLGTKYIIGTSTHSLNEAKKSLLQKPDYIAIGSIFKTATKPHLRPLGIGRALKIIDHTTIPYFVIGGINLRNINALTRRGINRIALYKAIIKTKNPEIITGRFKGILADHENAYR